MAKASFLAARMPQGQRWDSLDGVRAFAVVSVMLLHLGRPYLLPGGLFGVDIFFVLSGFLITSLLIGEAEKRKGRVNLRDFYIRRALRLLPALAAVIVFVVLAVSILRGLAPVRHSSLTGLPWVALYVSNWLRAVDVNMYPTGYPLGMLAHTWSLSVEMQFYLIWPLIFVACSLHKRPKRRISAVLFGIVILEWIYRASLALSGVSLDRISNGTDTHSDGLLIGCALAFWLASGFDPNKPRWAPSRLVVTLSVGLIAALVLFKSTAPSSSMTETVTGYTVVPIATAVILWNQLWTPLPALHSVLTFRPILWIGCRSYGLYIWHYPIYVIFAYATFRGTHPDVERQVCEFSFSFVVAAISFRLIEQPALRLKNRYSKTEAMPGTLLARRAENRGP
jgi:peptidoglycan/LPS O-acetylase OafA/YrhL